MRPIVDLHCDLLWYLAKDLNRSPLNPEVRCSIPQLNQGHVKFQTMAVFTTTDSKSVQSGMMQIANFKDLILRFGFQFNTLKKEAALDLDKKAIQIALAIENASSLCSEEETLDMFFQRFEQIENQVAKILYVTPTWNTENRFGGGAHTKIGIKEDGKKLLNFLNKKKVAIDLSHTSDQFAFDLLNEIDKNNFQIPVIASHSNSRAIANVPRNLPDELTQEIIKRKGLIGFVFCQEFLGYGDPKNVIYQMEHLLKVGGLNHICFGADFFFTGDLPADYQKAQDKFFYEGYDNASLYPRVLSEWQSQLNLSDEVCDLIAYKNFKSFYEDSLK
jgi:microsomal dipeptidase-like Zn-dependent dipeptidase